MNIQKFQRLPYGVRAKMIACMPLFKVNTLPAGNAHLPVPLVKDEIVINTKVVAANSTGQRYFIKIRHGKGKQTSTFDIDYFVPVK